MRIDIVSLFPDFFDAFFNHSIIKRAIETERLSVGVTNPRDFSHNKHGQVDDTPYGGGAGMLMMAPPIFEAVESIIAQYDSDINETYTTDEMCDEMSLIGNPNESISLWDLQDSLSLRRRLVNWLAMIKWFLFVVTMKV